MTWTFRDLDGMANSHFPLPKDFRLDHPLFIERCREDERSTARPIPTERAPKGESANRALEAAKTQ